MPSPPESEGNKPRRPLAESLSDTDLAPQPTFPARTTRNASVPIAGAVERAEQLTAAAIKLRRGQIAEARRDVEAILQTQPRSAEAHELMGDILLATSNFDAAAAEYRDAVACQPGRTSAETKLARATLRRAEDTWSHQKAVAGGTSAGDVDGSARKWAMTGSVVLPGLGQVVNGQYGKAALFAGVYALLAVLTVLQSDVKHLLKESALLLTPKAASVDFSGLGPMFWLLTLLSTVVWIWAAVDTWTTASRKFGAAGKS